MNAAALKILASAVGGSQPVFVCNGDSIKAAWFYTPEKYYTYSAWEGLITLDRYHESDEMFFYRWCSIMLTNYPDDKISFNTSVHEELSGWLAPLHPVHK